MENLHLKNLTKEALFKDVHRPRLIAFFNNKNLTRYNIEQLFKSFNIKTSKDVITAIYEICENKYSNKTALVNTTLNYVIQIKEKSSNKKTTYYVDNSVDNLIFLRTLFYILSENFILKEYFTSDEVKLLNNNLKKLIKQNQIVHDTKILEFITPTISSEINDNFNEILKENLKQNNYYNIPKKRI